ncbi:MAG: hypothetical protein ACI4LB_00385 [Candidatus Fimenecus sp.]
MKRIFCIVLCLCLFVPFVGCEIKGADKAFYDIPFTSKTTALVMLEDSEQTYQNEYYFFTSERELEKGVNALAQSFDIAVVADGETQSFLALTEQYTQEFFKENVLLFVKRYHSTEAVLQLQSMDAVNNAFQIQAQLESGAPAASVYRVYLLAFDKQYFLSGEASVDVKTVSVEPQTASELDALTIAVGDRYKTVEDEAAADALTEQIQNMHFTPSDYNPEDHTHAAGDITVVGCGFYAVFTDDYIGIGNAVYAPDSAAKQALLDTYQTLPGAIKTVSTVTESAE